MLDDEQGYDVFMKIIGAVTADHETWRHRLVAKRAAGPGYIVAAFYDDDRVQEQPDVERAASGP